MKQNQVGENDQLKQKMKMGWIQGMWIVRICLFGRQAPYVMNSIPGLLEAKGNFAKIVFGVIAIGVFGCVRMLAIWVGVKHAYKNKTC